MREPDKGFRCLGLASVVKRSSKMPAYASPTGATADRPGGIVILGGAHGTLALSRSLGALKVPVWLVSADTPLPGYSNSIRRKIDWPGPKDPEAVEFLIRLARDNDLAGYLLVAGGDAEVSLVSRSYEALSTVYDVRLTPWDRLQWLCEKPLLYRRAAELGVAFPATYEFGSLQEAFSAPIRFPVVVKPNMGGGSGRLAKAKVLRADDAASFKADYSEAVADLGQGNVVVQELIPGGGESQFSYTALWNGGEPVAEFTARRTRQYPVDFGYTSTFVEIATQPAALESARKLLRSIGHHGFVEIEFKLDARDGMLKVLDVNPRPWSWFGLAAASGVDYGAMLWSLATGEPVSPAEARIGTAWMYLVRDAVAALTLIGRGQLSTADYLRGFRKVRIWATFAPADPLPGLLDIPLTAWRVLTRRILKWR